MNPTIRRATVDDADAIAPLFDRYRIFYQQPSDPALAQRFIGERLQRDESVIFLAEAGGKVAFGHRHAHRHRHTLPQRAGGAFHARQFEIFRVAGAWAAQLAEGADIVDGFQHVFQRIGRVGIIDNSGNFGIGYYILETTGNTFQFA